LASRDLNPTLWRELKRLDALELLEPGEILVELELVVLGTDPGAFIVTDRRVLFVRTTTLGRKTRVVSLPFDGIFDVHSSSARWLGRNKGVLALSVTTDGSTRIHVFERIGRGRERSDEIAATILRQKESLRHPRSPR
jgi:hypothetical protein